VKFLEDGRIAFMVIIKKFIHQKQLTSGPQADSLAASVLPRIFSHLDIPELIPQKVTFQGLIDVKYDPRFKTWRTVLEKLPTRRGLRAFGFRTEFPGVRLFRVIPLHAQFDRKWNDSSKNVASPPGQKEKPLVATR